MEYWSVVIDGLDVHTQGLSFEEATESAARLNKNFGDMGFNYSVVVDPDYREEEPPHRNDNAVDGWEDLYSY